MGVTYAQRVRKQLEVDMSWASSRLEGNSYDHLETDFLRNIHSLLATQPIRDRSLVGSLRRMPVAVGRSSYTPLEDRFALQEELDIVLSKAARISDPFEQSFFLLVHIPYLQPFADVNKRTSRIASNIPLLKADLALMSFFAIDDEDYILGLLGVYELNDVSLLREAFVSGYIEAARRYRYLRPEALEGLELEAEA